MATNAHVHAIWLPLRLPALALECLGIYASSDQAVMVIDKQLVCAATQALQAVGVHIGMPVNTAQLIYDESKHKDGECYSYERGPQREAKTLKKISDELYSFTPYINTHRVNTSDNIQACGLQLELSRCIHLFKGLKPLLQNIATLMESYKIHFHYGLSHTPSGSWLLSYHENTQALPETQRLDIQQSIQNIHALPINYLHQHQNQLEALRILATLLNNLKRIPLPACANVFVMKLSMIC
ncbi:MAG: hypothetical protein COA42_22985 [Alteromonadaceae bacterium]|nr:MAG: hypothetical protein COA42_22985 [Alteromonadaceae bacterium]